MNNIKNKMVNVVKEVKMSVDDNSPTLLTGIGSVGVVSSVGFAVSATNRAVRDIIIEEYRRKEIFGEEYKMPLLDVVKICWRYYVPTAISTVVSIGAIIGSNNISMRRNAAIATVYGIAKNALAEYQEKVVEIVGEKKEEKLRDGIIQDRLSNDPLSNKEVFITGLGETLMYDSLSGRYFRGDIEKIRSVVNQFNHDILTQEMYKPLNDFYTEIGLEETEGGRDIGWDLDSGLLNIVFNAKIASNGQPCIVLNYAVAPRKL